MTSIAPPLEAFTTRDAAIAFMCETIDDPFIDDTYCAFEDEGASFVAAEDAAHCLGCGKFYKTVEIDGRRALLFATYGH